MRRAQRWRFPVWGLTVWGLLAALLLWGCSPAPEPRPRPEPLDPCAQKASKPFDEALLRGAVGTMLDDAAARRLTEAWGAGTTQEDHEGDWLVFAAQGARLLLGDRLAGEAGLIKRIELYAPAPVERQPWWSAMRRPCERSYGGALPLGLTFGMTLEQAEARLGAAHDRDCVRAGQCLFRQHGLLLRFSKDKLVAVGLQPAADP